MTFLFTELDVTKSSFMLKWEIESTKVLLNTTAVILHVPAKTKTGLFCIISVLNCQPSSSITPTG